MNSIADAFAGKKAFIAFITGGDPDMETTEALIVALAQAGVDIVEIGIPFSDPVAEGVVIQDADVRALNGGCTVDKLFEMAAHVRARVRVPLLFMTYINPVVAYGSDRFMQRCAECGIAGVIVPDMPYEEKPELADVCQAHGIALISMIAPTSIHRVRRIAASAEGFLYCVSSLGVTGVRTAIDTSIADLIAQARQVTSIPCAVGFGISTPEQAKAMAAVSDGVIIGSAFVRLVGEHGRDSIAPVAEFARQIKRAL